MKDPLDMRGGIDRDLFDAMVKLVTGKPMEIVWSVGANLIINAIRQSVAHRKDAEQLFDEIFGNAKTVLLAQHYDSVTGLRRGVIPFTQVVQMPFHQNHSVIFHGK